MDYNKTLNLPETDFSMRANLPTKEPEMLAAWESGGFYEKLLEKNEGKPLYILHDGPPYANGDIHTGHALNKILKDFIIRYKNMAGFKAPYVPGWDTHGLPIESQAIKKLGINRAETGPVEFRRICRDFALGYVDNQREQFKRLGVTGDWEHPYLTLTPDFEARQIEVFGEMAKKGYIYKGLRPVYWCPHDETALAEAEIEYSEDPCTSIYVKFKVKDDRGLIFDRAAGLDCYVVIWTTTTWTLPGNVAICLGPDFEYSLIRAGEEAYLVASERVDYLRQVAGLGEVEVLATYTGRELEFVTTQHPFLERDSVLIVGDHVTLDSGTGCVHTAPGFGADDFNICQNAYKGMFPVLVPVDGRGVLTEEAGELSAGLYYDKANKVIFDHLKETGALLASEQLTHQYPHCWRCKSPILFRVTEQWFCSVEDFKPQTLEAIRGVKWYPAWGEERISAMVTDRRDWCISRQRLWGVPIPIFYCRECGEPIINDATIKAVADLFRREGSDGWYAHTADEILAGAGVTCGKCGAAGFEKETDIMDVWFDSGSSHTAVLEQREGLQWPADLYLEGNDQHRGWFQSSLLTAVATRGEAPYKAVLTHGMVVDGEGRKMSKSLGNGIDPMDVVKQSGADILRLWVSSADYTGEVRLSKEILKQLSEIYRKIRNTARYILGNLTGFDVKADMVAPADMEEIDRWALSKLDELIAKVTAAYDSFEFYQVFHLVHNFCVVDMSNFYLDVIKDRLYCEGAQSPERASAQSAMFRVLDALTRMIAPILAFTAEEIWHAMPHLDGEDTESVFFNGFPKAGEGAGLVDGAKWERVHALRDDVKKALELARSEKFIGAALEGKVVLHGTPEAIGEIRAMDVDLATLFITSGVELADDGPGKGFAGESFAGVSVEVLKADGEKCERCWRYLPSVGSVAEHPTLCERCAHVVGKL
ncbi:isoleucine--tRNA ligase [Clostridiales bacterium BX7]|uniref:Isoleucine--tRNA ligase n=1 Tax=Feifania hominis TaxID=2763660 RepID=A0A926DEN7_9FIRM|nr:isoleucine--tRNA ligase [Feifania hominis]